MRIDTVAEFDQMAHNLDSGQLKTFKQNYCDENALIAEAIASQLNDKLVRPILDVGAGWGDVALGAFKDTPAILLDREIINGPISGMHQRVVGDFFEYARRCREPVGTLLLCHVLQYIDDDEKALAEAIKCMSPRNIITVTNDNTGDFGRIIEWAESNVPDANPEYPIDLEKLVTHKLHRQIPISATLSYPDFNGMARDLLSVIIDAKPNPPVQEKLRQLLASMLRRPNLLIEQTINYYE